MKLAGAWWTLVVLVVVMAVKTVLSRRVAAVGNEIGSTAVRTDAWHHLIVHVEPYENLPV